MLSSYLKLGLPSSIFLSGFPTKILCAFLILPRVLHTRPSHPPTPDLTTLIIPGEAYKLWSSSLYSLLQPPSTSSSLGSNTPLSTLFSNTIHLRSSFPCDAQRPLQRGAKLSTDRNVNDFNPVSSPSNLRLNYAKHWHRKCQTQSAFHTLTLLYIMHIATWHVRNRRIKHSQHGKKYPFLIKSH